MNIIIDQENLGKRVDKFLVEEFFSYTRGEIIRQIKKGNVLINNQTVKPSYVLKFGDSLEINLEEKEEKLFANEEVEFEVIYIDENVIAINKPAGLQVHPGFKNETDTLVNGLIYKFPEIVEAGEDFRRPGIVHRLDKDTSGLMVVAKNQKTFHELKEKFKNRNIKKTYEAIVWGHLNEKEGIIDKPIARAADYRKQVIAGSKTKTIVRTAVTEYKVAKEMSDVSIVELVPKTGRMHQLRVHLASLGYPIVGDGKYSLKDTPKMGLAFRQLLHAKKLQFELFGKQYSFEAKLPADFSRFLDEYGK